MSALDTIEFQPDAQNPVSRPAADTRPDPGFLETAGASFRLTVDDAVSAPIRGRNQAYYDIYNSLPEASRQRINDTVLKASPRFANANSPNTRYGLIWKEVERLRATDPKMFKSLPATQTEFETGILTTAKRGRALDRDVSGRGGTIANLAGGVGGSFFDPINLVSMLVSGGSSGIVRTMAREAAINSGVEALEIPFIRNQRRQYGEEYTLEEAGFNVLVAGLAGAGLAGAGKAVELGLPKAIDVIDSLTPLDKRLANALTAEVKGSDFNPADIRIAAAQAFDAGDDAELAHAVRALNPEGLSPETADAVHVLERQADIDASTPYKRTYGGDDAHHIQLSETLARIVNDLPAGPTASSPLHVGEAARTQFMQRVRQAESSGNDAAVPRDAKGNRLSSALGRYQFTDGTWLTYYGRAFGKTGETKAQILAKRTDGALQDRLMGMLTADNARALGRSGEAETAGNLYLAHFLGSRDAIKIIKAGEGVAARDILPAKTIAANRFLENMTADDLVAWAHRKMGEPVLDHGSRPIVRPDEFGDDAESLYLAQRDADEATMRRLASERDADPGIQLGDDAPQNGRSANNPEIDNVDPRPVDVSPDVRSTLAHQAHEWPQIVEQLRQAKGGEVEGALFHPATGPIDVVWGKAGRSENDGHGLAKIIAKHPDVVDELPSLIASMKVISESPNRIRLGNDTHKAVVRLDWDNAKKTWLLTAFRGEKAPAIAEDGRAVAGVQDGSPALGAGEPISENGAKSNMPADLAALASPYGLNAAGEHISGFYRFETPRGPITWDPVTGHANGAIFKRGDVTADDVRAALRDNGALSLDAIAMQDDPSARAALQRFDDPSGAAVTKAVESMTHDASMIDPGTVVLLSDQTGDVTVGDVLRSFAAEDAEIAEIRGCMTPPKVEGDA